MTIDKHQTYVINVKTKIRTDAKITQKQIMSLEYWIVTFVNTREPKRAALLSMLRLIMEETLSMIIEFFGVMIVEKISNSLQVFGTTNIIFMCNAYFNVKSVKKGYRLRIQLGNMSK